MDECDPEVDRVERPVCCPHCGSVEMTIEHYGVYTSGGEVIVNALLTCHNLACMPRVHAHRSSSCGAPYPSTMERDLYPKIVEDLVAKALGSTDGAHVTHVPGHCWSFGRHSQ